LHKYKLDKIFYIPVFSLLENNISIHKFKKNIWSLFYLILFIGTTLLAVAVYQEYDEILQSTKNEQQHQLHMFHDRLDALFREQELLQNVLANSYLNNTNFNNQTFDTLLGINPLLFGIVIVSKEGNLKFSSSAELRLPDLLQDKNTQQWFQETLNTDQMVIGKAYLLKSGHKWILPIRKKILDAKGNIVAVISTGLDLTMLQQMWDDLDNFHNTMQVTLDNGAFPILRSGLKIDEYAQHYNNSLPGKQLFGQHISQLKARSLAQKSAYLAPMIEHSEYSNTAKSIYSLSYNARYHFWTSAEIPYQFVVQNLYQQGFYYLVFYLLLIVTIFILFRWIANNEIKNIAELTYNAQHDELTGLVYTARYESFNSIAGMGEKPFTLLYLDLDNFKNINDTFGNRFGDLLLIKVAERIVKNVSPYKGTVSRYHGDEFVIFIESVDKIEINLFAKLLLENISQPYLIKRNHFKISASIGIACFPEHASDIETLLSYAGNSLFMAKKTKNQSQFFSKSEHHQLQRNIVIEQSLYQAVINQEITLVYQPQLDGNNKLFGVEALVRWHHKELGFIPPDVFIPIAENSGFMPQLGLYIMHKAMQEIALLKLQENLTFKLSINVSIRQFMKIDFIEKLISACNKYAIDKTDLNIEITESLFIESVDTLLPLFDKIKSNAISLSLDDFGTGYSSLSMLRKVPVDELKIDKSFVDHLTTNHADNVMVGIIINMGKALGMRIVAEGVEDKRQVTLLKKAGCDIFQGYYFSKPLALEELRIFAKKHCHSKTTKKVLAFAD
jgi:diguanylate cyclase (GGDEF)-like protein